jgi:hypothetical protein
LTTEKVFSLAGPKTESASPMAVEYTVSSFNPPNATLKAALSVSHIDIGSTHSLEVEPVFRSLNKSGNTWFHFHPLEQPFVWFPPQGYISMYVLCTRCTASFSVSFVCLLIMLFFHWL